MANDMAAHGQANPWLDDDGTCLGCWGMAEMTYYGITECDDCKGLPVRLPPPREGEEMTVQRLNARKGAAKQRAARQLEAGAPTGIEAVREPRETCPECHGKSPTLAKLASLNRLGDDTGICFVCNNTHEVSARDAEEWRERNE